MSSLPELLTIVEGVCDDGARVLSLRGELDASNADVLLAAVTRCDLEAGDALVVDVDGVTFVDSSGLTSFLRASAYLEGRSCRLVLRAPRQHVLKLLSIAGLAGSFEIVGRHDPVAAGPIDPGLGV